MTIGSSANGWMRCGCSAFTIIASRKYRRIVSSTSRGTRGKLAKRCRTLSAREGRGACSKSVIEGAVEDEVVLQDDMLLVDDMLVKAVMC